MHIIEENVQIRRGNSTLKGRKQLNDIETNFNKSKEMLNIGRKLLPTIVEY